jgi:FAD/FMN-containing dehydrogenase
MMTGMRAAVLPGLVATLACTSVLTYACHPAPPTRGIVAGAADDTAAARRVFEAAVDAYLSYYRHSDALTREHFARAQNEAARKRGTVALPRFADRIRVKAVILDGDPTVDIANTRRVRYVIRGGALYSRAELPPRRAR